MYMTIIVFILAPYIGRRISWFISRTILYHIPTVFAVILCLIWGCLVAYLTRSFILWQHLGLVLKIIAYSAGAYVLVPDSGLLDESTIPEHVQFCRDTISIVSSMAFVGASTAMAIRKTPGMDSQPKLLVFLVFVLLAATKYAIKTFLFLLGSVVSTYRNSIASRTIFGILFVWALGDAVFSFRNGPTWWAGAMFAVLSLVRNLVIACGIAIIWDWSSQKYRERKERKISAS